MSFLSGLLGLDAGKATQAASKKNQNLLTGLNDRGTGYINTGEQQSAGYLNQALGQYSPYNQTGLAANSMVGNALGLNGTAGNAAATSAFQAAPGYQFNLDQQLQATQRGAAAGGMLASGNLLTALQDRASGTANQAYGTWLSNLIGQSGQGLSAASQTANAYNNLANLYQQTAGQRLDFDNSITHGRMGANNQYAQGREANAAGLASLGQTLGSIAGKAIPFPGFGG